MKIKTSKERIKIEDRDPSKFYYDTRHSDTNRNSIATIEKYPVLVNRYNTVILPIEIDFGDADHMAYKDFLELIESFKAKEEIKAK